MLLRGQPTCPPVFILRLQGSNQPIVHLQRTSIGSLRPFSVSLSIDAA
jgi:hypothetical protein